jgi:hypothetical protein
MSARSLGFVAARVRQELVGTHPDLQVEVRDGAVRLVGPLRLCEDGTEIDRFDVEIVLSRRHPREVPWVYEMGGRIPRITDRHVYVEGHACLFAPGERWRHWPPGSSLAAFLDGPVRSYFVGQAYFELMEQWPFGQRSHGFEGILESYAELLRTTDPRTIMRYLTALARRKLRPRLPCPCGSGRPIHSCHRMKLADLRGKIHFREAHVALAIVIRQLRHAKQASAN